MGTGAGSFDWGFGFRVIWRLSFWKETTMEMSLARRYEKRRPMKIDWRRCCQSAIEIRR